MGKKMQNKTRRDFLITTLKASALAGGLGLCGSCSTSKPAGYPLNTRKRVLVPAHVWVYAATQPGYDVTPVLEQIFSDMSYAGMDGVELMHNALRHADAVERIGELSLRYKLPVAGASFEGKMWDRNLHNAILDDAAQVVSRLAQLGGRTLGTSVGAAPQPKTPAQLDAQAELLLKLIPLCRSFKVELNLHNHTYEVDNKMHDLKGTLERIPNACLGPDLNWLVRGGVDPVWFLDSFGSQIVFLHLRNQYASGKWSESLAEGDMDYDGIGLALKRIHFSGYATIELAHEAGFKPTRPIRESLKLSREFVRRKLETLLS
jgi:sugar phosphate isomerase/epimerase